MLFRSFETSASQSLQLVAGLQLGIAGAACDLAVAYAKERVQFDRPIGSFQALKHLMADMLVRVEVARGAAYAAGVTLDDPAVGSPERAVASAAVTASEAAVGNTKTCVQVHGGMGFTWEVDAHLLFKRAYALEPQFDPRDVWAERMADQVGYFKQHMAQLRDRLEYVPFGKSSWLQLALIYALAVRRPIPADGARNSPTRWECPSHTRRPRCGPRAAMWWRW